MHNKSCSCVRLYIQTLTTMTELTELTEQPTGLAVRIIETRPVAADSWRLLQAADQSWELWMLDTNVQALVDMGTLCVIVT